MNDMRINFQTIPESEAGSVAIGRRDR